jgi:hypothetical protein
MQITDLIDNIQKGDAQTSNNTFNSLMADKINSALNDRKQEIASSMYSTPEVADVEV